MTSAVSWIQRGGVLCYCHWVLEVWQHICCIINTQELIHEIKSTTLIGCWKKVWLAAINNLGILQPARWTKDHLCISVLKFQGNYSQTWWRQISWKYSFLMLLSKLKKILNGWQCSVYQTLKRILTLLWRGLFYLPVTCWKVSRWWMTELIIFLKLTSSWIGAWNFSIR